jgi:hypothetical protein
MLSLEKLTISTIARAILLQDSEIVSLVGTKIFPSVAPPDTPSPFVVYERDAYEKEEVKMGIVREIAVVTYEIVSDDYDTGLQIAVAMHRVLQGDHNDLTFEIVNSAERYAEGKFRQLIDFKIT